MYLFTTGLVYFGSIKFSFARSPETIREIWKRKFYIFDSKNTTEYAEN